jgi:hypothetical protein
MSLDTLGSNRDALVELAVTDRDELIRRNVLVGDARRWRPRWFDGRFLAASDLRAEQNYFLVRQAELGRAGGSGVVEGLLVTEGVQAQTGSDFLHIEGGFGFTDSGELVALLDGLDVNPADVPEMQRLDGAFGLQVIPNTTGIARTGLYVLALRPVEWSANPIGSYPTSLTGARTVEDGTVVEGVAISLIPYPDAGNDESWERRRARVARGIFVHGQDHGIDSGVLPIAMVALHGNLIEWVDNFMVRRETGAERPAGMDFGFGARALREAHLLQYQQHLASALTATAGTAFAAASRFDALPPVGQFPASTVDPDQLTHRFFPPGISVELGFIPEDELPALIEESLLLPPIDLTLDIADQAGLGVIVLVLLSRADFNSNRETLPNWDDPEEAVSIRPVVRDFVQASTPLELLMSRVRRPVPAEPPAPEPTWQQLLRSAVTGNNGSAQSVLWYVRRRHLPVSLNGPGTSVDAVNRALRSFGELNDLVRSDPVTRAGFNRLRELESPAVNSLLLRLSERRFLENPDLVRSLVHRAAGSPDAAPEPADVVASLAPLADTRLGSGLRSLSLTDPDLPKRLRSLEDSGTRALTEVDRLARDVPPDQMAAFSKELKKALPKSTRRRGAPEALAAKLAELRTTFVPEKP